MFHVEHCSRFANWRPVNYNFPYCSGSLLGNPAFLGYFFDVGSFFFTITRLRPISESRKIKVDCIFLYSTKQMNCFSLPYNLLFMLILIYKLSKHPPTFAYGRQYSHNVDMLATALDTTQSNCSLSSAFWRHPLHDNEQWRCFQDQAFQ